LDVNIAANKSKPQLCAALGRFHALTGFYSTIVLFMEKDSAQPTLF